MSYLEKPMLKPINRQEKAAGVDFRSNLPRWGEECANAFINGNGSLNDSVVRIANQNSLNESQVKLLIQEANTVAYAKKYSSLRGQTVRRPDFEIARMDQIRSRLNCCGSQTGLGEASEICASDNKIFMEKVAALKKETGLAGQWSYKMGSLIPDSHNNNDNEKILLMKKIAQKGCELMQKEASSTESFFKNVVVVSEALIKCAQYEGNENEVFNWLCKDASLKFENQVPLVAYIDKVLELRKEAGAVPKNFSVNLEVKKVAEPISLGEYSLDKVASKSRPKVPAMTAEDVLINDYEGLLAQASALLQTQAQMVEDTKAVEAFKEKIRNKGMNIVEEEKNHEQSGPQS